MGMATVLQIDHPVKKVIDDKWWNARPAEAPEHFSLSVRERNRLCSPSDCLHTRRTRYFHFFDCTHCTHYVYALPVRPIQPIRGLHFPNLSLINCSFPNDVDTLGLRRYRTLDACVDH